MSKTLVTGANGFVAAHVIDQLLKAGHTVTGSVRDPTKGQQILKTHPEYEGKIDFVTVSDYAKEGTWDEAFQTHEFDYVVHTAAPLLDNPANTDFDRDFCTLVSAGKVSSLKFHIPYVFRKLKILTRNTEILKSALKYGKNVKAIAVTGSINAITTGEDVNTRVFASDSWLPLTIDDARKAQNAYVSYCVGKKEADKAIWKFIEENKPPFTVSVFLPALIFGPAIQPVSDLKKINYSTDVFYSLFNGTYEVTPPTSFGSYIDVRDLAHAHILSLTTPAVANSRFLIGGHPYSSQLAVDCLKPIPELAGRLPRDNDEIPPKVQLGDVLEWNKKLGLVPRTPEETFGDAARRLLELEKEFGKN